MTFTLPFPPSMNHYWRRGKNSTYLSEAGREYKAKVRLLLEGMESFGEARLEVSVHLHPPTKRKWDLDNRLKPLFDSMEGIMYDNDEQIDILHAERCEQMEDGAAVVQIMEAY